MRLCNYRFGVVLLLVGAALCGPGVAAAADSDKLVPLNDLGSKKYQEFTGGLYAEGRNEPWGAHADALRQVSAAIGPLNRDGKPDPQGKIVVIGIGASVCRQLFATLETLAPATPGISPAVVFVNGARGGHDVNKIADPAGRYWEQAKAELQKQSLTPAQVQVAWYQSDDLRDARADFPGRPQRLKESIAGNMRLLKQHFPNVRICYHSARHTTAFMPANDAKNKHSEPRPYQCGWAVKWLIEEQAAGRAELRWDGPQAVMPLAAWATYFWTDADRPRADGYRWSRDDVVADGVHLSEAARQRVALELLAFFKSDAHAKTWCAARDKSAAPAAAPVIRKSDDPRDPAWIVNGNNKIPKLQRLLGTTVNVRVVVRDLQGKQVAEIRDVFSKRTNLNELVGQGEYRLEFYDKDGQRIKLTQEVADSLRLK